VHNTFELARFLDRQNLIELDNSVFDRPVVVNEPNMSWEVKGYCAPADTAGSIRVDDTEPDLEPADLDPTMWTPAARFFEAAYVDNGQFEGRPPV
jgi:hypothetical protein